MLCADPTQVKVCTSLTAATNAAVASCGSYQIVTELQIKPNTVCTTSQIALYTNSEFLTLTANPFLMSLREGSIIGASIVLIWATAWGIKALIRAIQSEPSNLEN